MLFLVFLELALWFLGFRTSHTLGGLLDQKQHDGDDEQDETLEGMGPQHGYGIARRIEQTLDLMVLRAPTRR